MFSAHYTPPEPVVTGEWSSGCSTYHTPASHPGAGVNSLLGSWYCPGPASPTCHLHHSVFDQLVMELGPAHPF